MKQIKNKKERGITLIALVVTIIVLIVLAGISINLIFGQLGVVTKSKEAKEENLKQTAKEVMNLKITSIQIANYTENKTLPSLQFLADKLCEDNDMEYVLTQSKAHASLGKIDVTNLSSIYTKLKEYPYEFEINDSLQLASIDGVKVADNNKEETVTLTKEQYDSVLNRLAKLENNANKNENYSTEEQVVGTWIDGKKLYRKVIREQITDYGGKPYFLSQSVPDAESYIIESAMAFEDSTYEGNSIVVSSSNNSITRYDISFTSFNLKTGRIYLVRGADSPSYLQLIVKYTKTTD